jgi:S1-C subfamily serine protease
MRPLATVACLLLASGSASTIDLPELAERAKRTVVLLSVADAAGNPRGTGTGFFVSPDGRIVTNHHVVEGGARVTATLWDGSEHEVLGILADDEDRDVAILKMKGQGLSTLPLGDPGTVRQGDEVAVIGSPRGLSGTLSVGIVSAVRERGITGDDDVPRSARAWAIQITAPISPGSSGSPILSRATGEVVAIAVGTHLGGQGLNFGVSIAAAKELLRGIGPGAEPRPFREVSGGSVTRNLLISAAVFGALGLAYLLLARQETRRKPADRRLPR